MFEQDCTAKLKLAAYVTFLNANVIGIVSCTPKIGTWFEQIVYLL